MKSRQQTLGSLIVATLITLFSSQFARADAERDLLLKVSAEKVDAMIIAASRDSSYCGCFISKDGLAAFSIDAFATHEATEAYFLIGGGREQLHPPTLRWFSPVLGLAIAKFDYEPKVIVEPSSEAVTVGMRLAILDPRMEGPVAIGPVTQITQGEVTNFLHPTSIPIFSVGAGLPAGYGSLPFPGAPIIDSNGRLRGTFSSIRDLRIQTLLNGVATDQWMDGIAQAKATKKNITFPLPPGVNPFDPASESLEYKKAALAAKEGKFAEAIENVRSALKTYPDSPLLHSLHFEIANVAGMTDELLALAEATKPTSGAGDSRQLSYYTFLAKAYLQTSDQVSAGKVLRKGLEIAPKDSDVIREQYSIWLSKEGKPDEALRYMREASEASPANIPLLTKLQNLLSEMSQWDEEAKVSERIFELEQLYRPTSLMDLRPKKR